MRYLLLILCVLTAAGLGYNCGYERGWQARQVSDQEWAKRHRAHAVGQAVELAVSKLAKQHNLKLGEWEYLILTGEIKRELGLPTSGTFVTP